MDKKEIKYINDQIDGLISDLESVLMDADYDDENTRHIDDALDGLRDAERALKNIIE